MIKPGEPLVLKDVLDPKPGPLVVSVPPLEQPVPVVVKDDLGLLGDANTVATAINSAVGRGRERYPRWVRLTAYVLAVLALTPPALSLVSYILSFF